MNQLGIATKPMKTQNNNMKTSPLAAFIFTAWLAGATLTADAQPAEAPPPPAAAPSKPAELIWLTSVPDALARAKAEGKSVLLFFHGSDWCPPCIEMQQQVFAAPEFVQFANRSLVLVNVDFPQKSAQSEELKQANRALKARFNLSPAAEEGFPTLVLLNDAGETVFQETGYAGGGAAAVLPELRRHAGIEAAPAAVTAYKNLGVEEFARLTEDQQNVILDVRTPEEFAAGHIPKAVNLDVNAPDFQAKAALLDRSKTYLVHCASGGRSVKACEQLNHLDFPKLFNLTGGFRAWTKAGQPVEK